LTDNRPTRLGSVLISDGALVSASGERGGTILVDANTLTLANRAVIENGTFGAGQSGNVRVEAQTVAIHDSEILSFTLGDGRGGDVTLIADTLTMDGSTSRLISATQLGTGDAGNVRVEAQRVTLTNGAQIQSGTLGAGRGGDLTVIARDSVIVDGFGGGLSSLITASSLPEATGDAGSVRVEAHTVTATKGAQISSATFGAGQGGSVTVLAHERVTFQGTSPEGEPLLGVLIPGDRTFPSGAFANSHGIGAPGIVQVTAPKVMLAAGGRISSLNIASERAGGTVMVNAPDTLEISGAGSGLRTRSFGPGQGGDIAVNAGTVSLTEGADISAASIPTAEAQGSGNAGNVTVTVRESLLLQNSFVTTEATQAKGGNITLQVQDLIRLRDSQITAAVGSGEGAGGNITLAPAAEFVVLEESQITANADAGPGGNITIQAEVFLTDPASSITASSDRNVPGTINIQAAITNLSGLVTPVSPDFAPVTALLHDPCVARLHAGTVSSFVVRGRASVPTSYDGPLPSRLYESPQHRTPPKGAGHLPQETTASSQIPTQSAGAPSPLQRDLPCAR
jgi:large exoprotein involved in heme utilization and adhesion